MRLQHTLLAPTPILMAFCSLMAASAAQAATMKIIGVTGASNVLLPTMQSTSPTATPSPTASTVTKIYGGTAGVALSGMRSENGATIDTCKAAGQTVNGTTLSKLFSCNNQAIDGNTVLTINFTAGDKAGFPILLASSTGATSSTVVQPVSLPAYVAAGASTSISVTWASICARMASTQPVNAGNCQTNGATTAGDMTFTLGLSSTSGATTADADSGTSIQVLVADFVGATGPADATGDLTTATCEDAGAEGVCAFAIGNGDGKVVLRDLVPGLNFPTGGLLPAWAMRLLWAPATSDSDFTAFSNISAASDSYRDLILDQNSQARPSVSPGRVTGFNNEDWLAFKVAVVDWAKNVGLYTSSANNVDQYCSHSTGGQTCHFGHPGEVVGVLSKDLTCFVATAAYGSQLAPQVEVLRQFRDIFLKPTVLGAKFVAWYYQHSPKYARMISQSETLRALARWALAPALFFAWLSVNFGMAAAAMICALIMLSISALAYAVTNAVRERRRQREADCQNA